MDRTAALNLAGRIRQHWSHHRWTTANENALLDALEQLDEGRAGTAFTRLQHLDEPPSPAQLIAEHRRLDTTRPPLVHCAICHGDGIQKAHRDDCPGPDTPECICNGMTWCRHCQTGKARRQAIEQACDHNDRELRRRGNAA